MKRYVEKSIQIYRNHGATGLIRKAAAFSYKKVRTLLGQPRRSRDYRTLWEEYEYISNPVFQITKGDIQKSNEAISGPIPKKISTANWLVPNFDHLKFGGILTIFRFINKFQEEGVSNRVIIYDNPSFDVGRLRRELAEVFPKLENVEVIIFDPSLQSINSLPSCDVAFCSFWTSAYLLLKFNKTKRKYYFIQDYEPLFYTAGSTYALAESTYRFGFRGLVNTPGLLAAVNKRHGTQGISFVPAVDQELYYPNPKKSNGRIRIFFYARPSNPRNAFNLGIAIIKQLLEKYGDKIEIITAGAVWEEGAFGLKGKITNLGLLKSLPEVAELYRSCDIGFVYMLSKHPSYQPFEFMASGMATVTNNNEDNLWLLEDEKNCLVSEPSPSAMAEQIGRLIEDRSLRQKIVQNGLKTLGHSWDQQTETIWNDIVNT